MRKKIIKASVVFCIVFNVALVCSMEVCASPIQDEQANIAEDINGQVKETIEGAQNASAYIVPDERKETENGTTEPTVGKTMIASFAPSMLRRIVTVGDFPDNYDPSLVLRKGRSIPIGLNLPMFSEDTDSPFGYFNSFNIKENIYDDSGQLLLLPKGTTIDCLYMVSEEKDKMKIVITVMDMYLDLYRNVAVQFSNPPICTTNGDRKRKMNELLSSNSDAKKMKEEYLQLREQLFKSPVISAELILGVESEDRTPLYGKIIFGENASGDRTVFIDSGFKLNIHVKKDILFSSPYFGQIDVW